MGKVARALQVIVVDCVALVALAALLGVTICVSPLILAGAAWDRRKRR